MKIYGDKEEYYAFGSKRYVVYVDHYLRTAALRDILGITGFYNNDWFINGMYVKDMHKEPWTVETSLDEDGDLIDGVIVFDADVFADDSVEYET